MNEIIVIYDVFGRNAIQDIGGIEVINGINYAVSIDDVDISNDFYDSINKALDDTIDSIDDIIGSIYNVNRWN